MDIGIFGLWGMNVPGRTFGGFEAVYSEVAARLVCQGHSVTIYSRRECYAESQRIQTCKNVKIVYVPTINTKSLSFLTSITYSLVYSIIFKTHDILLFVNVGSGFHCLLAELFGMKTVLNVDGLDWNRPKWNSLGKTYFKLAAKAALFSCDVVITDGNAMVDYYRKNFKQNLDMISYGADIEQSENINLIHSLGLASREFYLVVTRLIPDNNIHLIVEAFQKSSTLRKLVVVGDANYESEYQRRLRSIRDDRIMFIGRVHDQNLLRELYCHCYAYIHGHSVGGTNPALLKALGYGSAVLALNTPFNAEVLSDGKFGELWEKDASILCAIINRFDCDTKMTKKFRQLGPARIREAYSWEEVTEKYVELFKQVINGRSESKLRIILLRLFLVLIVFLLLYLIV